MVRRFVTLGFILLMVVAPLGVPTASAAEVRTGSYMRTTDELNLRAGPGVGYRVRVVIPHGARLWIESGPYRTYWYQAAYRGRSGYVHGAYLGPGYARSFTKLNTTAKVVALTFDAGSDTGYTRQILDTLAARGVKASFGITGRWAEANPSLMRRIVREGHTVINHTYTHRSFTTGYPYLNRPLTYEERTRELWKTQSAVARLTGGTTKPYFRPPYGAYDRSVEADVWSRGYAYNVMWSVDSLGWNGLTKGQIVQRVLNGLEPGAIYLFHVGSQSQDGPALPSIIRELRERGYTFALISDYYR